MKILWITNSPCSSEERRSSGIIAGGWMSSLEKAVRQDIDLSIAYLSSERNQEDFEYEGVHYHSINPYKSRIYILFRLKRLLMGPRTRDRRILSRLQEIIPEAGPDLIHIHGTENCYGLIVRQDGTVPCGGRSVPAAVSMQGLMDIYYRKYFSGIPAAAVRKYESIGQRLRKKGAFRGWRKLRHQAANEPVMLRNLRNVFGRTDFDRMETCLVNPEIRYFKVGEIMRAPFFSSVSRNVAKDGHFTVVSTISDGIYKGYEQLLRAATLLGMALKDRSAGQNETAGEGSGRPGGMEWIVIGYSSDDEMVRIAERYTGLDSAALGIRFCGRLNAAQMVPVLDSADVYCHVSHIENSPNSVCEAMLRALPVVAADVGGVSSLVEDGIAGLLFPDSDARACADALTSLFLYPKRAFEMGQAGRRIALERHSPETVRRQLLSAYRDILADE